MKSLEDRYEEAKEDPVKVKRAFTAIWVASYAMLILGAFIIVGVLIYERLLRTKKQGPLGPIFPLYLTKTSVVTACFCLLFIAYAGRSPHPTHRSCHANAIYFRRSGWP